ncbi:Uncharacterized protein CK203_009629 [Vitis vinifera]|uniref:Glutaredoxin domain-containing protein n=1 Tax=Vitis vinifera TaxID=29760 RepID=A0A438JSL9_VITVI|nr:Uncharacterized protein CK203_009629 [Vitis vinifera]
MGCASSKLFRKDLQQEILDKNGECLNHVVSLTSSTYGALKLDNDLPNKESVAEPKRSLRGKKLRSLMLGSSWKVSKTEYPLRLPLRRGLRGLEGKRISNEQMGSEAAGEDQIVAQNWMSLSPLFDPELLASFEKELSEEKEQIKKIVSPIPKVQKLRNSRDCESILDLFEKKCPPGGANAVVIYTTTLRGIRKTFEDCNHGRLIGGADEVVKLEEEGKLDILFDGIPRALAGCQGCAGVRFVMCMACNGSCKLLDEDQKKMVKCSECNENGLIQCPICC